jgi:hypothetical protein
MKRLALMATAALVAIAAAATSTAASADAVVTRQTITTFPTGTIPSDSCNAGATGTISGIDTVSSQSVQTLAGFHVEGTDVFSGRIDWSDGSYSIIGSTDRFAFNTTDGTTVFTDTHVDFADNYSASGVLESQGTFHADTHFAVTNGVIVRVTFDFQRPHGTFC